MGYLGKLLDEDSIDGLVAEANEQLAQLQFELPADDSRPLRQKLAGLQKKIARCVERGAATEDDTVAAEYERHEFRPGQRHRRLDRFHADGVAAADRRHGRDTGSLVLLGLVQLHRANGRYL